MTDEPETVECEGSGTPAKDPGFAAGWCPTCDQVVALVDTGLVIRHRRPRRERE